MGVGYFHQRYNDLIATVPADSGPKQTNKNVGRTQAIGVEMELEREWSARWRTGANLTWVKTEVLDNTGLDATSYPIGGSLPEAPSVTGSAFVAADLSQALDAATGAPAAARST